MWWNVKKNGEPYVWRNVRPGAAVTLGKLFGVLRKFQKEWLKSEIETFSVDKPVFLPKGTKIANKNLT